ncbi:caspase family protein [Streptomyces sp. M10(2022)]
MNRPPVEPHRIVALVVGIEKYAAGADWNLRDRPGTLCGSVTGCWPAVFPSAMSCCISRRWTAPLRVPHRPADHDALRRALVTDIPARGGEALWIWWGGHGVLDREEHLRLYCADATAADRRNIDIESARNMLRSDAVTGLGRQFWMVDACQTFDERHSFPHTLPEERLPAGQRVEAHEQVLMFAAGRGQRAANDPGRRLGLFSDIVLNELPADPLPDPDTLFEAVEARLGALRAAGHTGQFPSLFLHRSGRTDISPVAAPVVHPPRRVPPDRAGRWPGSSTPCWRIR